MMSFIDTLNRYLTDYSVREIRKIRPIVDQVIRLHASPEIQKLTREDLPKKTEEFKARVAAGTFLEDLTVEAFAVVMRACELLQGDKTTMGRQEFSWYMVPFPVQLIGGIVLHRGNIAEMKTGEGKTLVCTLPVYLNALAGRGVHVVTVNDYLAKRDSAWMGMLYKSLGLTVGCVVHELDTNQRREAYGSDITYGTNNEFGFDYLRDNMASSVKQQVQRGLHFAIVDEVDSILIDEARTPLIISQPAAESTTKYMQYATLVRQLTEHTHFTKDEKQRTASLTEEGIRKMEELLGLDNIYTDKGFEEVHHIEQALRAHAIYQRDVDYVAKDDEIIIVDEFTGRLMPGRRYGHGLHQAIEAKEGVTVQRESKTLATITFQNYFRLYKKLSGMTGTAKTEEEEFESIYKLRTIVIPTHRPMIRDDKTDAVYRTVADKFRAVARMAKEKYMQGQPILIGTTSIEKSEALSKLLEQEGVPHNVLNAKNHEREAEIVAKAGEKGSVTIATNMAGRGTDIKLGEGVTELGGLGILGTERHEARRIDNQLRGRSGRQGDPGESQFFVSMEDDLMRLFGGERLKSMMERLNVPADVPLQNNMVSRSIESAQKRVEGHNFDIRKHVLQYDDVMNKHRDIIYKRRQRILEKLDEDRTADRGQRTEGERLRSPKSEVRSPESSLHDDIIKSITREARVIAENNASGGDPESWTVQGLREALAGLHPELGLGITEEMIRPIRERDILIERTVAAVTAYYEEKCSATDAAAVAQAERVVTLRAIDTHWMDHIDDMSHLREQVAFAGYAQRDPLIEYQDQGFRRFRQLLGNIESTIVRTLLQIDFAQFAPRKVLEQAEAELRALQTNEAQIADELERTGVSDDLSPDVSGSPAISGTGASGMQMPPMRMKTPPKTAPKTIGRNDPCPCGSGKKYKKCHGKNL
ncbi:preprotein translocase subunit SecA [Candidatus Peregrinibacteria bacterium]|nr:preprotein translocase subunit SecA [Candidatus Peregrinibacteria bacterium]